MSSFPKELCIPIRSPLNENDTEKQTYGCRQTNPDIRRNELKLFFDESGYSGCIMPNKNGQLFNDGQRHFVF